MLRADLLLTDDGKLIRRTVWWPNITLAVSTQCKYSEAAYLWMQWANSPSMFTFMVGNPAGYYDYHPRTLAAGLYAREEWDLSARWRLTGRYTHDLSHTRELGGLLPPRETFYLADLGVLDSHRGTGLGKPACEGESDAGR